MNGCSLVHQKYIVQSSHDEPFLANYYYRKEKRRCHLRKDGGLHIWNLDHPLSLLQ